MSSSVDPLHEDGEQVLFGAADADAERQGSSIIWDQVANIWDLFGDMGVVFERVEKEILSCWCGIKCDGAGTFGAGSSDRSESLQRPTGPSVTRR